MAGTANRVIKNTGFLYAKMGVTMFISLYTTRLILNSLGVSDFGIFNIVGGAIAMLGFLNAAMAGATQRFMSYCEGEGDKEKQKRIFNISLMLHLFVALTIGIVLFIAGLFFFSGFLNIPPDRMTAARVVYGSLIISTVFTVMTVPYDATMNAHENMKYYALIGIIESLLKLSVAVIVVYTSSDKLIVYGILMACIPIVSLTIMRIYCHKKYEECLIAPKQYWDKTLMKEMTGFAGWNFLGTASSMISQYGLGLVINVFYGPIANAAQGIALQVSGQAGALGLHISKSLQPVIVKSVSTHDRTLTLKSISLGTKAMLFVETICFLPFIIETNYILRLWLKTVPANAGIFVILLLLTNLIDTTYLFLGTCIGATGKIKYYQRANSIIAFAPILISLAAFSMGAPVYTIYIATIITASLKLLCHCYYSNKLCKITFSYIYHNILKGYGLSFFLACIVGIGVASILPSGLERFIVNTALCLSTFTIAFIVFDLNAFERTEVRNFISQIYHRIKKTK